MNQLFFWHTWQRSLRLSYWILLVVLLAVIGFYLTAYWTGSSWVVPVEVQTELQPNKQTLSEVNIGIFNIPIEGEIFLPAQQYKTHNFQFPAWLYNLYGGILAFCMVLLLSIFTRLKSLWYALGMTCFILFLSAIQLDNLLVVKAGNNTLLLMALVAYIALTFSLQSFARSWAWHWHFLVIAAFTTLFFGYCYMKSPLLNPAVFLVNYGITIPVLLTLVFITMTAHDIPHIFFHLIVKYNKQGGSSNIIHIFVITSLYILHLFLYYFDTTNFVRLGLTFVDTRWLLLISAILGIWGYQKRENLIAHIIPFAPTGAFLYIAMAIISFSTIAFAQATSQDTLIWVFRDFTLYAYIGFGIVFMMYVVLNFNEPIRDGLEVEKVTYEGKLIPYNTARYFGFLVILMFIVAGKQFMYYQLVANYFNAVGDTYYMHNDIPQAKINYQQAVANDLINHHSRYALADIAGQENNPSEQMSALRTALHREPLPQTYLQISQLYLKAEDNFHALFTLQEGIRKFPTSAVLHNNLALRYKERQVTDSAFYHLEKAKKYAQDEIPQNNLWAILAEKKVSDADLNKLPEVINETENIVGRANKLALYARYNKPLTLKPLNKIGEKNLQKDLSAHLAYAYNYGLNRLGETDESVLKNLAAFEKADNNGTNNYRVVLLKAFYEYYRGNTDKGIQTLAGSSSITKEPYENTILGLWLLEQGAYQTAEYYLGQAVNLGNIREGKFYRAIALSEIGNFADAAELWKEVAQWNPKAGEKELSARDNEIKKMAGKILGVLADDAVINDDIDRFNFIHYKRNIAPTAILTNLYNELKDNNLKAKAGCNIIEVLLAKREIAKAMDIALTLPDATKLPDAIFSEVNYTKLNLLAAQQKFDELETQIKQAKLNWLHRRGVDYLFAQIAEDKNDLKKAEKHYLEAALRQPCNENTIVGAARFFQNKGKNSDKAYQILVEAVRTNPYSIALQQAYAQQALIVGLEDYADKALEEVKKLADAEDFETFKKLYEQQKENIKKARANP